MMPTALVGGAARQRRRTADGRARARLVRVLKGYLKRGILKGVLKRDAQKGVRKKGTRKGILKRGYSKRVIQTRDYKGMLKKGMKRSGETASGARGRICAVYGGQCTTEQWPVWYGRMYRVLTPHSRNGFPVRRLRRAYCRASLVSTRACAPALRVGCDRRVLTGYSQGTPTVLRYPAEQVALLRVLISV